MRIDAVHSTGNARAPSSTNDLMSRPAPAHVDTLRWNLADAGERQRLLAEPAKPQNADQNAHQPQEGPGAKSRPAPETSFGGTIMGTGQAFMRQGSALTELGAASHMRGRDMLSKSHDIFTRYPAHYSQRWTFFESPVNRKGGASGPLVRYLDHAGIKHNAERPRIAPTGSVANAADAARNGIPANQINNHNGRIAEDVLADELRAKGYTVQRNVIVKTPLGDRELDILATKNVGHPTLSEEIRIESKVGHKSLPKTAQGSNVRRQIDKDAAALADYRANAPEAHAKGRQLHAQGTEAVERGGYLTRAGKAVQVVGKVARPLGAVVSAFEIRGAYEADGNKIGVNTVGKTAALAGGAGGAWAGAAAGAALGSVVPGVGTVIGGVVGGIAGGLLGEAVVSKAFDSVKSWFS